MKGTWNDIWEWAFDPANDAVVSGWSFWLTIVGFTLTILGFGLAFRQLYLAKTAAQAAADETKRIELSLQRYDAVQEASRASYALNAAQNHLRNQAWGDAVDCYYDVKKALVSLRGNVTTFEIELLRKIDRATSYISRLCERADRGELANLSQDDLAKTKTIMRQHEELVASIVVHIQKEVF